MFACQDLTSFILARLQSFWKMIIPGLGAHFTDNFSMYKQTDQQLNFTLILIINQLSLQNFVHEFKWKMELQWN